MKITKNMIKRGTVKHRSSEEQAEELLKKLNELGYSWDNGDSYLDSNEFHWLAENIVYYPFEGTFGHIDNAKKNYFKIIEYVLDKIIYKELLDKANTRITELESKLEEYKNIDDVMNLDVDEFLCYFQKITKDVNNGIEEMLLGDNTIVIVAWLERMKKMLDQLLLN